MHKTNESVTRVSGKRSAWDNTAVNRFFGRCCKRDWAAGHGPVGLLARGCLHESLARLLEGGRCTPVCTPEAHTVSTVLQQVQGLSKRSRTPPRRCFRPVSETTARVVTACAWRPLCVTFSDDKNKKTIHPHVCILSTVSSFQAAWDSKLEAPPAVGAATPLPLLSLSFSFHKLTRINS